MSELDKHITLENFERLYSEYKPRFIIIARSYIRNNMAAEDIVTDSFLYFWENKDKLNITTTIQAYILGSVKHGCLEWLRNQKNRLKSRKRRSADGRLRPVCLARYIEKAYGRSQRGRRAKCRAADGVVMTLTDVADVMGARALNAHRRGRSGGFGRR